MNVNRSSYILDGETLYFNNKVNLQDFYASDKVATTQKIFTLFLIQHLATGVITWQNSNLRNFVTASKVKEIQDVRTRTRTVQKALKNLENVGFFETRKYDFKGGDGEYDWQLGMNKRTIRVNTKVAKELIKLIPGDITIGTKYKKGGTASRIMRQRPFTLVEFLMNEVIKHTVNEVNARRRVINRYLEKQAKKFNLSDDSNIEFLNDCMTQVHKLFASEVPPDLKAYLNN